ncbi:MAG TPA: substrate-binding domain-containing protein [Streptosporangiaceae bacterium]|nr:substrate-binding domain-containing protein [Streptosporangiaceae bacterium]
MARRAGTAAPGAAAGGPASGRRARSRRVSTAALAAIAVAISATVMVTLSAQAIAAHASCTSHPVLLNVAVTNDLAPAVERVAQAFNRQQHTALGRCAQVQVTEDQSATVASRIDGQSSSRGLPPVDAWIPDSRLWVDVARSFPQGAQVVQPTGLEVAQSPVMIVMPRLVASRTHAFSSPAGWNLLLPPADGGPPASLGIRVDLPDPTDSAAGLATLVELSRLLGPGAAARATFTKFVLSAETTSQFDDPASLASFVSTAGPPLNSRPVTVTSEQAVIAYDRANPSQPLAAQYPAAFRASLGSPDLDYPYVLTTSDPAELQAAREFRQALAQPYATSVIRYDGFRSADGIVASTPASFGLRSQVLQQAATASASEAQTTLEIWGKLGLGSRDLVLIDVSSSMARLDGNGTQTLEQELTKTSVLGLALFPDSTQMGEWQIASKIDNGRPYQQLVPVGSLPAKVGLFSRRQQLQQIDQTLHPLGHALALNDAILAAYKQMLASYRPSYSNSVIVLTSGVDNAPGDLPVSSLLARLHALFNPNRKVAIVILMLGTVGNFSAMQQVAAATGGAAFDITNPAQVARAFIEGFSLRLCDLHCAAP